jgi:preprotein translocase subunit SecF
MNFRGKNIDLVGKMKLWFAISILLMLVGALAWAVNQARSGQGLNLGIDFTGGSQVTYRLPPNARPRAGEEAALLAKVNEGLKTARLEGTRSQIVGGQDLVISTPIATQAEATTQTKIVSAAVGKAVGQPTIQPEGRELVGPVIGEELRRNAIWGVTLGVLAIALWIYIRYNFAGDGLRYAVAGIVALVHDVIVLLGLSALLRIEVDGAFIAALLTVVGYSINDSVVIFDRLRENLRSRRGEPFDRVVNDSLLETMSRSINTGATVLIMLAALLFFGGESIYNFTLAMLLGIASGLYSSIFNASMVLVLWNRIDEKKSAQARANRANRQSVSVREAPRSKAMKTR